MLEGVNMTKSKKSLAIFYDQNVFFFESLKNLEEQERRDRIFDFLQENNQVVKQLGEIFHGMNKREAINKIFPFLRPFPFFCEFLYSYFEYQEFLIQQGNIKPVYEQFLKDVLAYDVLSAEEEKKLLEQYQKTKDKNTRDTIIKHNLRLVISIAKQYTYSKIDLNDLIMCGVEGLFDAIEHFELQKNCKFSTYATPWIKQKIRNQMYGNSMVYEPINFKVKVVSYIRYCTEYEEKYGNFPSDESIKKRFSLTDEQLKRIKESAEIKIYFFEGYKRESANDELRNPAIIDEKVNVEEEVVEEVFYHQMLETIKKHLSEKEFIILIYRYGLFGKEKETLESVAKRIGSSKERVRQIEKEILTKLSRNRDVKKLYLSQK